MTQIDTRFAGRVITVNVETVRLPNDRVADLEIVRHPGGATAVALDDHSRVCLLRQFRHAGEGWLWELPAGKLEPGEPPFATVRRELVEEAGVSAREWHDLGILRPSPGVLTEVIHLFLARGLQPATLAHEEHEVIEVHWIPLEEACERAVAGDIVDAKTVAGLLRTQAWLRSGRLPPVLAGP
ncbi:MAG: hypothetical protein RL026_2401 [Pseudomonadota bacterium]|jgi:ADP-ribose pyrophosphatase